MSTYSPLQPGQAPAIGTSGQAVSDLQTQLNAQNQGKPGWTPLLVDGLFGTKTQAAQSWKPTNQLIVTGTNPAKEFAKNTQEINQMIEGRAAANATGNTTANTADGTGDNANADLSNYSDSYTQMLDKISATSDKATQNLIATIKAKKANQLTSVNDNYDRLESGLMSLGLSTGEINYSPEMVYGKITQAENQRTQKLQQLDQEEATAQLEAQQAAEKNDFELLKERKDYIKEIKNQKLELLKQNYETLSYENKIGEEQATQVYDELQKMPEDKKLPFLQTLADKFNIPLVALTSQVSELGRKRNKSSGSTASTTKTKNTAISGINSILNNREKDASGYSVRGEDNYVDPSVYLDVFHQWQDAGFSDKEFFSKFDPKIYVNPDSYSLLPENFKPKKSSDSGDWNP